MKVIGIFLWVFLYFSGYFIVQSVREFVVDRIVVAFINDEYVGFNNTIRRVNRTDYSVSVYLEVKKDGASDYIIDIQLYTLHNNQYREGPGKVRRGVCSFLENEYKMVGHILEPYGNTPHGCPMEKGVYYIKDFILDSSYPNIPDSPWEHFMLRVNAFLHNQLMITVHYYISFNSDAKIINKVLGET